MGTEAAISASVAVSGKIGIESVIGDNGYRKYRTLGVSAAWAVAPIESALQMHALAVKIRKELVQRIPLDVEFQSIPRPAIPRQEGLKAIFLVEITIFRAP
jgi:hypothetical protein